MKRITSLLLTILMLFSVFTIKVSANEYTEQDIINRVTASETKAKDVIGLLTTWSNNYKDTTKSLMNKNFIDSLGSDYETNINIVIRELSNKGYSAASSSLEAIKPELVEKLNYIKDSMNMAEEYLNAHADNGVPGSSDLFYQIKVTGRNLKPSIKSLLNLYYDMYYNEAESKINSFTTYADCKDFYNKVMDKYDAANSLLNKYDNRLNSWQDIYNKYDLESYEVKNYFSDFYSRIKTDGNALYDKAEAKLQSILDDKITIIVNDTDISNPESILQRNSKLYNIIDEITSVKQDVNSKYQELVNHIKINELQTYANKAQTKINNRLDEAIEYTKSYLLLYTYLDVKKASDRTYINIDHENKLIIYNQTDLNSNNFINRLKADYGTLSYDNLYGSNIGTLSKININYNDQISSQYTIIVKGDIAPTGRLDITDVVKLSDKIFEKIELDNIQKIAADIDNNNVYDITDVVKLCDKIFK